MNDLDVQLENIDEQLLGYSPKQRWTIYIGSFLGILMMGWSFYLSDTLDEYNSLVEENRQLEQKAAASSPEAYQAKISQTSAAIAKESAKAVALEQEKETLISELGNDQGLIFDNRRYSLMLDRILERSVKLGVEIHLMESEESNKTFFGKIREYKRLTVTGSGRFPSIADFLAFIESQNGLVDIQNVQITSDEKNPRFKAVILFMGVDL